MKKSSALLIAAALILSSCGAVTRLATSDDSQRFQDGIYNNTPAFRTKAEKEESQTESKALAQKTKESQIYLFGDKKDTVSIPQDMSAMIRYDQKLGGTVVTVGENPYEWRYDLENNYGYYYGPYSIGSSWYWSRHYSPWYAWDFAPWRYRGWYDGWHYGSWYNPYYYGGFYGGWYDPWYWGSHWGWYDPWYNPHYCGWYGGWDPYWGHHHHHHHGPGHIGGPDHHKDVWYGSRHRTGSERVFASGSSLRGGIGSRSTVSRNSSSTGRSTASRAQASGSISSGRTPSGRNFASGSSASGNRSSVIRTTPSIRNEKTSGRHTAVSAQGPAGRESASASRPAASTGRTGYSSQSNHRRPAAATTSGLSADRSSSTSRSSSSYRSSSADRSSSYDRSTSRSSSNSSSYNRSSSSASSRSSYSSGSSGSYSRGSSGGGYSGGGSSRSGGSSGGRR